MSQAHDANRENQSEANVRRAHTPDLRYEEMSELGRELFDLSRDYESSGGELLTEDEIENELMRRRGGHLQQNAA
ncbi:MAG TPA: hypothetical protein VF591_12770 [Pyrinomonadaceae bacterium]|jgi:hypothetical protein